MTQRSSGIPFGYGPSLLGSFLLGVCIIYSNGAYSDIALICVFLATLTLTWRWLVSLRGDPSASGDTTTATGLAWIGLAGMLWITWNDQGLIMYARRPMEVGRDAQIGMILLLCSYLPALVSGAREHSVIRSVRFALFAACVVAAAVDTLKISPSPAIDVWTVQMKGAEAFSLGQNPYTVVATGDTGPAGASLIIPYVYPPLQIYLSWIGWKLFGDVRYTMIIALIVSGVVMRSIARSGRPGFSALIEDAPALFFWLTPKQFFIIEQGWIDPVQVVFVALALSAHYRRRPWLSAVFLGLVAASKQSMVLLVPLAAVMFRLTIQQWVVIGATAGLTLAPYAIWDFKAFKYAVIELENLLPPRPDALTFNNWAARKYGWKVTGKPGFALAAIVMATSMWRLRGGALFASAVTLTYLLLFAFNKWAFANYYYFVAGLASLAAAASFHDPALEKNR